MKILRDTDILRIITSAAGRIEVNASYGDYTSPSSLALDRPANAVITTATTTTIVGSPAAGVRRNVKDVSITNNSTSVANLISVEHFDGTNAAELISFILLPGENCYMSENGGWIHNDATGAPYPPIGQGNYGGFSVTLLKNETAGDGVGFIYCSSKDPGFPGAWSPGTPGVNGRVTDGTTSADFGCVPIPNPAAGGNYLTEANIGGTVGQNHFLFDCLWVNTGLSVTTLTEQAIASPTLPARDINGTTNGEGCMIAALATAALGNAAIKGDTTVRYTNSEGVANRTATLAAVTGIGFPATPVIGTLVFFQLQAGDKGVQSIQGFTAVSTFTSGSLSLMIIRPLANVPAPIANIAGTSRGKTRLYNGTCMLHGHWIASTTATVVQGNIVVQAQ